MKGLHGRQGPPPDPNALRRDRDGKDWTHLPSAGRTAPAPDWPLTRPTRRERDLWKVEWQRPQALIWEVNGQAIEVALYIRALADAERSQASAALRTLVARHQEALGISLSGLARLRWIIDTDDAASAPVRTTTEPSTVKARLRLLHDKEDA